MKKVFACLAALALLLVCCLPAIAAETPTLPSNIPGVIAYTFDNLETVTYGENNTYDFYDSLGTDETGIVAELLDNDGNKTVKFNFTEDYSDRIILRDTIGGREDGGAWPEVTETPKGFFIHVTTGDEEISFYMGLYLAVKEGVLLNASNEPVPGGTAFRFFMGLSTQTIYLYEADGTPVDDMISFNGGYNATVHVPDHFDGYIVYEFSDSLYMEGGNGYKPVGNGNFSYQNVPMDYIQWFGEGQFWFTLYFDQGVYGGENSFITFDDYGYLTAFCEEEPAPTAPPTDAPTVAPSVVPTTVAPTDAPTDAPTAAPTVVPTTDAPTVAPTVVPIDAPASPVLWIVLGAVVIVAAVVVILLTKKANK